MTFLSDLDRRTQEIFRCLVETYLETGEPIGSRTLSQRLKLSLSPATIRNIMARLEEAGLLYAPHISAGRLPTDAGMSLFVNALLEIGDLSLEERTHLENLCMQKKSSPTETIENVIERLSQLSECAGLVLAPKKEAALRHIEFVSLSHNQALVIIVTEEDTVENRLVHIPQGLPASVLVEATHYLNTRVIGKTLKEAWTLVQAELSERQGELHALTRKLVQAGLATAAPTSSLEYIIVKGQGNLLQHVRENEDLVYLRRLFSILETREALAQLLEATIAGEGVQIFMGAENSLFVSSGCSAIVSPCIRKDTKGQPRVIGVVGVVGPTRMNYSRIIPLVDFTAHVVGGLLEE
jgi:heat-inducible transcriptional repressor